MIVEGAKVGNGNFSAHNTRDGWLQGEEPQGKQSQGKRPLRRLRWKEGFFCWEHKR